MRERALFRSVIIGSKAGSLEYAGLFGELATALLPATLDYFPAAGSSHSGTETATALSFRLRRLIGALHKIILPLRNKARDNMRFAVHCQATILKR